VGPDNEPFPSLLGWIMGDWIMGDWIMGGWIMGRWIRSG
jgi:hypothetical protein